MQWADIDQAAVAKLCQTSHKSGEQLDSINTGQSDFLGSITCHMQGNYNVNLQHMPLMNMASSSKVFLRLEQASLFVEITIRLILSQAT